MRQEQDSLGEVRLSDEEYFGISTARLLAVADSFGPRIPQRLAKNIVRVRQAQALALGRSGAWNEQVAESVVAAAERLVADEDFLQPNYESVRCMVAAPEAWLSISMKCWLMSHCNFNASLWASIIGSRLCCVWISGLQPNRCV